MLPAQHRLRRSRDFSRTIRAGRRSGRSTVVAHLAVCDPSDGPTTVGFVVSRAVGNAVVRNRVKRRLREIVRRELIEMPTGRSLVLRALPPANSVTYGQLQRDVHAVVQRSASKVGAQR